jgi:hypothetical protein
LLLDSAIIKADAKSPKEQSQTAQRQNGPALKKNQHLMGQNGRVPDGTKALCVSCADVSTFTFSFDIKERLFYCYVNFVNKIMLLEVFADTSAIIFGLLISSLAFGPSLSSQIQTHQHQLLTTLCYQLNTPFIYYQHRLSH